MSLSHIIPDERAEHVARHRSAQCSVLSSKHVSTRLRTEHSALSTVCLCIISVLLVFPLAAEPTPDPAAAVHGITLRIEKKKSGDPVSSGILATSDGYFLTKASETPKWDELHFRTFGGAEVKTREVRRDASLDLVLGQVIDAQKTTVTRWGESKSIALGQWLLAAKDAGKEVRFGVMSATRRAIKGNGAAMGVYMEDAKDNKGVRIVDVGTDSPAESAGLQKDDILVAIGGQIIEVRDHVKEAIASLQPGEEIEIRYRRKGKEAKCTVRLASKTKIESNWSGEDYANGGISIRTDSFPEVIQHDIPLGPADMGGPLLNLMGQVIGINIARVDRITTFALPVESFWPEVQKWIEADRHPPKAGVK